MSNGLGPGTMAPRATAPCPLALRRRGASARVLSWVLLSLSLSSFLSRSRRGASAFTTLSRPTRSTRRATSRSWYDPAAVCAVQGTRLVGSSPGFVAMPRRTHCRPAADPSPCCLAWLVLPLYSHKPMTLPFLSATGPLRCHLASLASPLLIPAALTCSLAGAPPMGVRHGLGARGAQRRNLRLGVRTRRC